MKRFLILALMIALVGPALANIPDEANSTCEPWDTNGCALISPGTPAEGKSSVDCVTITVRNSDGDPIAGSEVVMDFGDCNNLCWCDPPAISGTTGADGVVVICPSGGGCEDCSVVIRADGVTICSYGAVRSPDWNGTECDGLVTGADFAFFATAFKVTQDTCADYNCDGPVTGIDFAIFATAFAFGDACP